MLQLISLLVYLFFVTILSLSFIENLLKMIKLLDIYIMQLLTPDFKLYNVFYTQVHIIQETLR